MTPALLTRAQNVGNILKILYIFRHAKSDWSQPGQHDSERPLATRGQKAALAMGRYFDRAKITPDVILCSPARRARETLEQARTKWSGKPAVHYRPELYLAEPPILLDAVRSLDDDHKSAMIVGHEPGLSHLVLALAKSKGTGRVGHTARERIENKFPTAALAVLSFPFDSWQNIAPGTAEIDEFIRPRDLDD